MKIITDSTADLTKEFILKHNIEIVPLTIHLGDKSWKDYYDVETDEYYELLRKSSAFPTTSQPTPQDFVNAYSPFVEKGEPILSVHLSSKLSGTFQSALLARSQFAGARIEVVDSLQASFALSMIVIICAEKANQGASLEEVADVARKIGPQIETYFSVDSLEYLHRGGRIGKAQAFLGTLMKIKPLLKVVNGEVQPIEKIRTRDRLLNRFVELVEQAAREHSQLILTVAESDNSEVMTELLGRLERIPGVSLVFRGKIGGVITSHAGPGALGIAFVKDMLK
ncbi:MAG: degV family protein [Deltaproteobacteria bacterium]|nr:degV family protein [Deltaproteobacteria bacterium]